MKGPLGTSAAIALAVLAFAPSAQGQVEQTRDSYTERIEPICKANREANERIMAGARERINKDNLVPAGKQFIRASASVGGLAKKLGAVPPPPSDTRRINRWLEFVRLLKTRLHNVGKYYKEGLEIKATHESILAERAGLSANNIMVVFTKLRYCRFNRVG
jgi:hypothetical protein